MIALQVDKEPDDKG